MSKWTQILLLAISLPTAGAAAAYDGPDYQRSARGPQGDSWQSIARLPAWQGAWALTTESFMVVLKTSDVVGPGRIPPFTAEYAALHASSVRKRMNGEAYGDNAATCMPSGMPSIEGHSIGHWENDVLVMDTVGLNGRGELLVGVKASPRMRIVQRLRKVSADLLQNDVTIHDATMFTGPYHFSRQYRHNPLGMHQAFCTENNRDDNMRVDLTPPPE